MLYMAHPPISTSLQFCCLAIVLLNNVKVKSGALFRYSKNYAQYVQKFVCARVSCVTDVTPSASFSAFFLPPPNPQTDREAGNEKPNPGTSLARIFLAGGRRSEFRSRP